MNTATQHPVAPEEIMALLDGELTNAESRAVLQHLEECAACASLEEQFRATSQALAGWSVPAPPKELDERVERQRSAIASAQRNVKPPIYGFNKWKPWAFAGAGALVLVAAILFVGLAVMVPHSPRKYLRQTVAFDEPLSSPAAGSAASAPMPQPMAASKGELRAGTLAKLDAVPESGPMIARSVSLTILVKNVADARAALDAILEDNHAYAAQLNLNTPDDGSRSFQASLRIPATQLAGALDSLRRLGHVESESQSGEEVTQQHVDLTARLNNARVTEQQLRTILQQRAGKMEDVCRWRNRSPKRAGRSRPWRRNSRLWSIAWRLPLSICN